MHTIFETTIAKKETCIEYETHLTEEDVELRLIRGSLHRWEPQTETKPPSMEKALNEWSYFD